MRELIEWILNIWTAYWDDGFFQYLLMISGVYLFIKRRKDRSIGTLLCVCGIGLFVFACPVSAWVISKCIGKSVYWRVLWLIPTIPVIAAAVAEFTRGKKRLIKTLIVTVMVLITAIGGEGMFSAGNYVRVGNRQQVSDTVAQICNIIRQDAGEKEIYLATDDFVASYARVYDASIQMPYGRGGRGAETKRAKRLYRLINNGKYVKAAKVAKKVECNYVVISMPEERKRKIFLNRGYEEIGTVNYYRIFAYRGTS